MNKRKRMSIPERVGRWAGRAWCGYVRRERGVLRWLNSKSVPMFLAQTLLWGIKALLIGVMLYAIFWVAVVLIGAVVAIWLLRNVDGTEEPQWGVGGREDHRQSIFYHPASHNDDPDPRFEDD